MNITNIKKNNLDKVMQSVEKRINDFNNHGITIDTIMSKLKSCSVKVKNCPKNPNSDLISDISYDGQNVTKCYYSYSTTTTPQINDAEKREIAAIGMVLKLIYDELKDKNLDFNNTIIDIKIRDKEDDFVLLIHRLAAKLLIPYTGIRIPNDMAYDLLRSYEYDSDFKDEYIKNLMTTYNITEEIAKISLLNINPNFSSSFITSDNKFKNNHQVSTKMHPRQRKKVN